MSSYYNDRRGGNDDKRWSASSYENYARLYVGRISRSITERDIDDAFAKYGRIRDIDMKNGFCFIHFDDPRDAEDAMRALDGVRIPGNDERIIVEVARGSNWRQNRESRYRGRYYNNRQPRERCFNCGQIGLGIGMCN
ncbi:2303_t:CDS:2 [Entrophospora sp. SA101]|nr:2303_t:CDS:2 [Entrophospora sp. SA101]